MNGFDFPQLFERDEEGAVCYWTLRTGEPTEIYGALVIEPHEIAAVRKLPFASVWVFDNDDDVSPTERLRSLDELDVEDSSYDHETSTWRFYVEMHDDDWANTDRDVVRRFLKTVPLLEGRGLVVTREGWKRVPEELFLMHQGRVVYRSIVDGETTDPECISLDGASSLLRELSWGAAETLFEQLQSRP